MNEALKYIVQNPTLSFHAVAVKFNVNAHELQKEFSKRYHGQKELV